MKNTLTDLNNHLFESLERLNDAASAEEIETEIKRGETISKIAKAIIENGELALSAQKHFDEYGKSLVVESPLLGFANEELVEKNQMLEERNASLKNRIDKLEKY